VRSRRKLVRRVFLAVALGALVLLLWRQWDDVVESLKAVSPAALVVSIGFGTLGAGIPALIWRSLLISQGARVGVGEACRTYFLSQLGKYVPGGVWSLVAQVDFARDMRVPVRQAATATFLNLALNLIAGLVVAGCTLPFAVPGVLGRFWWAFLPVPVLLALLHPRAITWWSGIAFRLLRRPVTPVDLPWSVLLRCLALSVVGWVALGLHFGVLVAGLGPMEPSTWMLSIGAFALAWIAGFLVVIAPAGAGVREAALVLAFAGVLPTAAVLTVALLSRVLLIAADVLLAGATALVVRGRPVDVAPASD
jgi:glycosyltransferase 2 family protein